MAIVHVPGRDAGKIMLYALSTCGWCRRDKALLDSMGLAYDYEDVDLLQGAEREKAIQEVTAWNRDCNFPTLIINNKKCIVGYKEDEIREALGG